MFKMKPQFHSWKEYQYRHANDNDSPSRRCWLRDDQVIHETADGFIAKDSSGTLEGIFMSFEEAEKAFSQSSK